MLITKTLALGLGLTSSASAAAINLKARAALACNADNCLRALRAAQPATRLAQASADCSSFMGLGVLPVAEPATSTITTTEIVTVSETSTLTVGSTNTIYVDVTATTIVQGTETLTVTSPPPSLITPLKRRDDTPIVPAFAAPCSGAARFTSACACIGVTSLPGDGVPPVQQVLTTVTVTSSETSSFVETITSTIDLSVARTVATTTETQAAATATLLSFKITVGFPASANRPTEYLSCDIATCVVKPSRDDATDFYMPISGGAITRADGMELAGPANTIVDVGLFPADWWGPEGQGISCSIDSMNKLSGTLAAPYANTNIWYTINYFGSNESTDNNDYLLLVDSDTAQMIDGVTDVKGYPISLTAIAA
ncbi:hypothetical protein Dda_0032 [Drechslerella dactyloides]|uniref:Uncharacterized protein n=1 Tax=Drechslerella dactyloides TaxID=74499 RepID=A0AAD6J5Y9_DREDA|nr:hypothetical protein Dda_0032 [Drechslerella dactyloides]